MANMPDEVSDTDNHVRVVSDIEKAFEEWNNPPDVTYRERLFFESLREYASSAEEALLYPLMEEFYTQRIQPLEILYRPYALEWVIPEFPHLPEKDEKLKRQERTAISADKQRKIKSETKPRPKTVFKNKPTNSRTMGRKSQR